MFGVEAVIVVVRPSRTILACPSTICTLNAGGSSAKASELNIVAMRASVKRIGDLFVFINDTLNYIILNTGVNLKNQVFYL